MHKPVEKMPMCTTATKANRGTTFEEPKKHIGAASIDEVRLYSLVDDLSIGSEKRKLCLQSKQTVIAVLSTNLHHTLQAVATLRIQRRVEAKDLLAPMRRLASARRCGQERALLNGMLGRPTEECIKVAAEAVDASVACDPHDAARLDGLRQLVFPC